MHECRHLTEQLDSNKSAADHDHRKELSASLRIGLYVRALESLDEMITEQKSVGHRLERASVLGSGNHGHVGSRSKGNYDMIERELAGVTLGDANVNHLAIDIHFLDSAFDEVNPSKAWPDWLCTVAKLEHARARLEEKRTQQEEIVAAYECDLDIVTATDQPIEMTRCGKAADPSTEDDDLLLDLFHALARVSGKPRNRLRSPQYHDIDTGIQCIGACLSGNISILWRRTQRAIRWRSIRH
jgi:hypothetical protein